MSQYPKQTGKLNFKLSQCDQTNAIVEELEEKQRCEQKILADIAVLKELSTYAGTFTGRMRVMQSNLQQLPKGSMIEVDFEEIEGQVATAFLKKNPGQGFAIDVETDTSKLQPSNPPTYAHQSPVSAVKAENWQVAIVGHDYQADFERLSDALKRASPAPEKVAEAFGRAMEKKIRQAADSSVQADARFQERFRGAGAQKRSWRDAKNLRPR